MRWDLDGNGILTKEEFTNYIDMPNIFTMLDKNNDGGVDGTELQSSLEMLRNRDRESAAAKGGDS